MKNWFSYQRKLKKKQESHKLRIKKKTTNIELKEEILKNSSTNEAENNREINQNIPLIAPNYQNNSNNGQLSIPFQSNPFVFVATGYLLVPSQNQALMPTNLLTFY